MKHNLRNNERYHTLSYPNRYPNRAEVAISRAGPGSESAAVAAIANEKRRQWGANPIAFDLNLLDESGGITLKQTLAIYY